MNVLIRRVRKNEIQKLSELCAKDNRWAKYFTKHDIWLERAYKDIKSNDRIVIGIFQPHMEGDYPKQELVGCIFLKRSQLDDSVEFKNLIIPANESDLAYEQMTATLLLIDKAIKFCEVRGIETLEVEFPQEEHDIISMFLSKGFRITAVRERYSSGNLVCILERKMGNTYQGDPFDTMKLSEWFLKSYLPCQILPTSGDNTVLNIYFQIVPPINLYSKIKPISENQFQNGEMWVLEDGDSLDEITEELTDSSHNKNFQIILNLTENFKESVKSELELGGITYFDKDEILNIAGGNHSTLNIPIRLNDIGGIITVLEYDTIVKYASQDTLTYYLLSGLNAGICLDFDNKYPVIVAIYCPNWKNQGAGIIGYANIYKVSRPKFEEVLNKQIPEDSALDLEELKFYRTYSENERIATLTCSKIKLFSEPIPITGNKIPIEESIRKYLEKEIIAHGNNSAYLDINTCNQLKEVSIQNIKSPISKNDGALPIVVILTAIREEYEAVKQHLVEVIEEKINDTIYESGFFKYENIKVAKVIIRECGPRNENAAIETERAIRSFLPDVILLVGIAGSRKPKDFNLGDVVFPTKIYSYEGGKSDKDMFKARPELESSTFTITEIAKSERRKNDWKKLLKSEHELEIKADLGIIASGEQIVEHYESSVGKILEKFYNDTSAVEMEGFGFAKAVSKQGRETNNVLFGVIRGISDILKQPSNMEEESNESDRRPTNMKKIASESASAFAFWLLIKLYEK